MSVALQGLPGVDAVKVSLNEGAATLQLKPGSKVTLEQVREVIRKNGFSPKESRVKVAGEIIERNGHPALRVSGLDTVLLLENWKGTGKQVALTGVISGEGPGPAVLQVTGAAPGVTPAAP